MPLIFRDNAPGGTGPRTPPWLVGLAGLYRAGNLLFREEPAYLPEPEAIRWYDIAETAGEWSVGLAGTDPAVNQYLRQRGDLLGASPVSDVAGRQWFAPQILNEDGGVHLVLPWGKDPASGVRTRVPTADQAALIAVANAARTEILSTQLATTPVDVIASWVLPLLTALYHLPEGAFDSLGLLDDKLGIEVLLTAIGRPKPAAESMAANG